MLFVDDGRRVTKECGLSDSPLCVTDGNDVSISCVIFTKSIEIFASSC